MGNTSKQKYTTVTELSSALGVSRKTLYKRAKEANIELSGEYTQAELDVLSKRSVTSVSVTKGNTSEQKETPDETTNKVIELLEKQISDLKNDKENLFIELENKNKIIDQAQQLQLQIQMQLDSEKTKVLELETTISESKTSFWKRLFG